MSVDCNLNIELLKHSEDNLKKIYKDGIELVLSNNEKVIYNIGDKPNTALCDYMETCSYNCKNKGHYEEDCILPFDRMLNIIPDLACF